MNYNMLNSMPNANSKYKQWLLLFLLLMSFLVDGFSQVAINGPGCVVMGTEYQYNISGIAPGTSTVQVCVTGGVITTTDSSCFTGSAVAFIRVKWTNSNNGSITLSCQAGDTSLQINVTKILAGGTIDSLSRQRMIPQGSIPAVISCGLATGGNCLPQYHYQWQQSADGITWSEIAGATGKNLQLPSAISTNTYYRRKVTEFIAHSETYSDIAIVLLTQ